MLLFSAVKVEQLERTDEYVISAWQRLVLLVWRDKASVAGIERSRAIFDEWAKFKPTGAGFLVVIPGEHTRPPDKETRDAMQRTANMPSPQCKGMATLLEAEGFVAASVRLIMSRLHFRGDQNGEANVFGDVADAATWAAELLEDPGITPKRLGEAIRLMRAGWTPMSMRGQL